jgi:hypothetical protein
MKKISYFLVAVFISIGFQVKAHEGMWIPMLLRQNFAAMQRMGLKLTPEQIYSVNHSSLKDAIAGLSNSPNPQGFFCTSEIVSSQGLLFTNHHCGFESVQKHSSVKHDYLKDGFWAMSQKEELPNKGLTASILVRMANVTDSIIPHLSDTMNQQQRASVVRPIISRLKKANSEDGKYNVVIKPYFEGNKYYMLVYIVYRDVRLVGAPPSSIGKFGGDTDNWMWPRQTGDFTIFRIYTAPDGSPATYSIKNVPLKPKYHLPISLNGIKPGDFAMVWGFPGSTNRYMTAPELEFRMQHYFPPLVEAFGKKLEVWKKHMSANPDVQIKYASNYAMIANSWKYFIGQMRGVKKQHVIAKKAAFDKTFAQWVSENPQRQAKYGNALKDMTDAFKAESKTIEPLIYASITGAQGAELLSFAQKYSSIEGLLKQIKETKDKAQKAKKLERVKKMASAMAEKLQKSYKDYDMPTDRDVFAAMTKLFFEKVPESMHPEYLDKMVKKYKNNFDAFANYVFEKSHFSTEAKAKAFLANPTLKEIEKDPAFILSQAYMAKLMDASSSYRASSGKLAKGKRLFMEGIMQMEPDKVFYPDANSTLRYSYGKVEGYYPRDGIHDLFQTHLYGVMQKEDSTNPEFIVPKKLKELYETKDYGPYGQDGKQDVNFLTTNDITGGNSGSPVINGNGELIGLAFDGNWEAMSGDIAYIPKLQRTIVVDIRYVLFIIDKYAGDTRLIDEMTLHKAVPQPDRVEATTAPAAASAK